MIDANEVLECTLKLLPIAATYKVSAADLLIALRSYLYPQLCSDRIVSGTLPPVLQTAIVDVCLGVLSRHRGFESDLCRQGIGDYMLANNPDFGPVDGFPDWMDYYVRKGDFVGQRHFCPAGVVKSGAIRQQIPIFAKLRVWVQMTALSPIDYSNCRPADKPTS